MNTHEEYKKWLTYCKDDPALLEELKAIENDEQAIEDRFYTTLSFGTAGMRGEIGAGLNRMNVLNVRLATLALAKYILKNVPEQAQRGVAIAYDSRNMSDVFAKQAALTLCKAGIPAYLYESLRPVPVLSFTIGHLKTLSGIVITASHNPAKYNGYKVYWEDGGQMPPDRATKITEERDKLTFEEAVAMDEQEALDKGLLRMIGKDVDDAYIASVKELCVDPALCREMGKSLKLVYTPLYGSGNLPVRRILSEVGFENVTVVKEQELPNGNFPGLEVPNPEVPAALSLALKMQEETGADVVFGTDPDCDRVGIAVKDTNGTVHSMTGNQIGCLLLHYILSQKKERGTLPTNGAAVKSIVSTEMARDICDHFGVELMDVLTGFKYIAEKIEEFEHTKEHTFLFGFEESNGFLSGTKVRDKDGVNACMLIAELAALCKKKNITLYDYLQNLYKEFGYYGENVASVVFKGKDGIEKMASIMENLRVNPPKDFGGFKVLAVRDYLTGIRKAGEKEEKITLPQSNVLYYELENHAWVCVRPSGTEPKIKLYVNVKGKNPEDRDNALDCIATAAKKAIGA